MTDTVFISKAKNIILHHLGDEKFGVSELAAEMGLSRSQLLRKIRADRGSSANLFIRGIRLEEAKKMLLEDQLTASEIAYKVGFSSPSYFNKCFHEAHGVTPGDFKKQIGSPDQDIPRQRKHRHNKRSGRILISGVAAAALVTLLLLGRNMINENEQISFRDPAIAVLPLVDLSGEQNMDYLAVGLTDAITLELSRINGLRVISRGSAMLFRDSLKLYSEIAAKLGVDMLLEGSVMFHSDSMRITVQLIQPFPEEKHLWAEKYDQSMMNILKVSDEISNQIAGQIHMVIAPEEEEQPARMVDPEAYEYYLRGKYAWQQQNPASLNKAMEYLKASLEIDPEFAPAYCTLAECYITMNKLYYNQEEKLKNRQDSWDAINMALDRAIELDGSLAEAYITRGNLLAKFSWDWEGMKNMVDKGLELNPNNPTGHFLLANYYSVTGDFKHAKAAAKQAEKLDPLDPRTGCEVAEVLMLDHRFQEAVEQYNKVLDLFPGYGFAYDGIGLAYYLLNEPEKAKNSWKELHRIMGNQSMADYFEQETFKNSVNYWLSRVTAGSKLYCSNPSIVAMAHMIVDDREGAVNYLEFAYKYLNEDLPLLMLHPVFFSLHDDPRFIKIAKATGIVIQS